MILSSNLLIVGQPVVRRGAGSPERPEPSSAVEMKPKPQSAVDLKPKVGSVVEEP
jgi:hypothetical protein